MQLFVLSIHCTSKAHCRTCRNLVDGHKWRESLSKLYDLPDHKIDFDCPYGKPWGDQNKDSVESKPSQKLSKEERIAKARANGSRDGGCGCSRNKR